VRPSDLRVDPVVAAEIATAHQDAPRVGDALAVAAYGRLRAESDALFAQITEPGRAGRVRIVFTDGMAPYESASELIRSVRDERVLEVTSAARDRDRRHPLLSCRRGGAYDRFRAVHDVLGHAAPGVGFDRHGEFAAWRFQERFHSPLARRALATELHGEHSIRWITGELAEHKAALLDARLVVRSRARSPVPGPARLGGSPDSIDPPSTRPCR
jgi:hypothetical protein